MGRPFGRKPKFREATVQTDAELGALLESVSALNAGESSSLDRGKCDSVVLLRRQNILMMQLRKISRQNREMREVIAKYQQIPNLLQAIKVHYESTFNSIRDDMAMLVREQQNRETKLMGHLRNQKCSIEQLIAIKDEKLKAKEEKNKALKEEKKLLHQNLGLLQEALELEQRRAQVAVKEQCNALDEAQEIRQKMHDKLFLAANQRCSTCQTRESVQDDLTGQIADKIHQIEELRSLLQMKEESIVEKDRINQILIGEVEKNRGELKDKAFATNSYQSELAKQQRKLRQAQIEIQQMKAKAQIGSTNNNNNNMMTLSYEQQPNPNILTPPEDESGPTFCSLPNEQQHNFFNKNAPLSTGNSIRNKKIGGENEGTGEFQNGRMRRKLSEDGLPLSAFDKRPRVVPSPTNDANCSVGLENGGSTAKDGQSLAHGTANKRIFHGDDGTVKTLTGGEGADNKRRGEKVTTEGFFRSPPPMNRRDSSNNALAAPPQQPKQQQQVSTASKCWRPTTDNKQQLQTQKAQQQQTMTITHTHNNQQQHQRPLPPPPPLSVGPTPSSKPTTPSSIGPSFRKSGGATIDDFCHVALKAATYNSSKGRTPPPTDGGGGAVMSGTWRKSVPDTFFINRPADSHREVYGPPSVVTTNSAAVSVAALPPLYANQQQNFPPPRPPAPIPRPPIRTFVQQLQTFNNINNSHCAPRLLNHQQQNGGGTLPWHSQSSGTFPCTTSQQQSHHRSNTQFFIR
ncbi:hypothetical protein niasHS_010171 [Heterodera schachtii]|uniref:Uncharacterized protein n=1 Tax=Heterodera schachtii TaxID=97005 RepID=A0ABD2IYX6_HETSC